MMEVPLRLCTPGEGEDSLCLLQGEQLNLKLTVEMGVLRCREARTRTVVPIITSISSISSPSDFQLFLKECRFSFQLRQGLKFAVKGRGGGPCCSKSGPVSNPVIKLLPKIHEPSHMSIQKLLFSYKTTFLLMRKFTKSQGSQQQRNQRKSLSLHRSSS